MKFMQSEKFICRPPNWGILRKCVVPEDYGGATRCRTQRRHLSCTSLPHILEHRRARAIREPASLSPRLLICILFVFLAVLLLPAPAVHADEVLYLYDDAGRLTRVLKGNEAMTYLYDEVGNLLSITRGTVSPVPPVLQSLAPDVFFRGVDIQAVLTGQHLLTTRDVTSGNPALRVRTLSVADTQIKLSVTVDQNASPGSVPLTVTTLYGSATVEATITLSVVTLSPDRLSLTAGNSAVITAVISPPIGKDVPLQIINSNPSVASAPQTTVLPSGGNAALTISPLTEGTTTIAVGDAQANIFVLGSVMATSLPVTVFQPAEPTGSGTQLSPPVSIVIQGGETFILSPAVSIQRSQP